MRKKVETTEKNGKNAEIGHRLNQIRKVFFGGDTAAFAEAVGIHYTNVAKLVSGEYTLNYERTRNLLAKCPDLSAEWLILGTGTMRNSQNINGSNNVANGQNISNVTTCDPSLVKSIADLSEANKRHADTIAELTANNNRLIDLLSKR